MEKKINISLPINRWQLFKFTYRNHLSLIIKLSLMIAIFSIPLFTFLIVKNVFANALLSQMNQDNELIILQRYYYQEIIFDIFYIPCFVILAIGLSGGFFVMKKYLYQEGFIFLKDFRNGMKKSKEFILSTLILSIILYLLLFLKNFLSYINFQYYIPLSIFVFIIVFLLVNVSIFTYCQIHIYSNDIFHLIKNSLCFSFNQLFKVSLINLITIFPLVLFMNFQNAVLTIIIILIYFIIGFGNCLLITMLYSCSVFDRLINKDRFPSIYRKGLYNGEDDE